MSETAAEPQATPQDGSLAAAATAFDGILARQKADTQAPAKAQPEQEKAEAKAEPDPKQASAAPEKESESEPTKPEVKLWKVKGRRRRDRSRRGRTPQGLLAHRRLHPQDPRARETAERVGRGRTESVAGSPRAAAIVARRSQDRDRSAHAQGAGLEHAPRDNVRDGLQRETGGLVRAEGSTRPHHGRTGPSQRRRRSRSDQGVPIVGR
jgi:hypothetical protein